MHPGRATGRGGGEGTGTGEGPHQRGIQAVVREQPVLHHGATLAWWLARSALLQPLPMPALMCPRVAAGGGMKTRRRTGMAAEEGQGQVAAGRRTCGQACAMSLTPGPLPQRQRQRGAGQPPVLCPRSHLVLAQGGARMYTYSPVTSSLRLASTRTHVCRAHDVHLSACAPLLPRPPACTLAEHGLPLAQLAWKPHKGRGAQARLYTHTHDHFESVLRFMPSATLARWQAGPWQAMPASHTSHG